MAEPIPQPPPPRKTCTICHQALPATTEYFYRRAQTADGLRYECRTCNRATLNRATAAQKARKRAGPPDLAKTLAPQLAALAPPAAVTARDTARDIAREIIGPKEQRELLKVALGEALGKGGRPPNKDMLKLLVGVIFGNTIVDDPAEGPLADFDRAFWAQLARTATADGAGGLGGVDLGAGGLSAPAEPAGVPPGAAPGRDGSAD